MFRRVLFLSQSGKAGDALKVVVPVLPRISNHTDFDPLRLHPQVDLQFIGPGQSIPEADLIILPGSKSVRSDLGNLRAKGWATASNRHLSYGGKRSVERRDGNAGGRRLRSR